MSDLSPDLKALTDLIATLRGENGCPWDRKQTPESLGVYLVEEIFELVDAIGSDNADSVCEELGDVLFQILFVIRLFEERGRFRLSDVLGRIVEKMIRRHPHVFGTESAEDAEAVRRKWHEIKRRESEGKTEASVLDSVPVRLPALLRAYRISERAARTGFDWENIDGVMAKVEEEWAEFVAEVTLHRPGDTDSGRMQLEFGDVLFTLVNVARFAAIHPETSLRHAIEKFEGRFRRMERLAAKRGRALDTLSRSDLDRLWEEVKLRDTES